MGIRKRAKQRKRYRHNDTAKKRKRRNQRKLLTRIEEHAVQREWDTSKSANTNLDDMGLVFNLDKRKPSKADLICVNKIAFTPKDEESVPSTSKKSKGKKGKKPEEMQVADELEASATKRVKKQVLGGTRLPRDLTDFATMMLDKHGNNFKDMARDPMNIYQDTWKQIRTKIRRFVTNPRYFAPYLKERNRLHLPELPPETEMMED